RQIRALPQTRVATRRVNPRSPSRSARSISASSSCGERPCARAQSSQVAVHVSQSSAPRGTISARSTCTSPSCSHNCLHHAGLWNVSNPSCHHGARWSGHASTSVRRPGTTIPRRPPWFQERHNRAEELGFRPEVVVSVDADDCVEVTFRKIEACRVTVHCGDDVAQSGVGNSCGVLLSPDPEIDRLHLYAKLSGEEDR
ncbi:MAG: hypothetical protein QOE48_3986, partial [Mycobacterium sp.]|nr:hypothetical protein [Mycobacterium sp.]